MPLTRSEATLDLSKWLSIHNVVVVVYINKSEYLFDLATTKSQLQRLTNQICLSLWLFINTICDVVPQSKILNELYAHANSVQWEGQRQTEARVSPLVQ